MAQHYHIKNHKKKSSSVYKAGRLTRSTRFSHHKINKKWIIVIACVLASFVFAIVFGNILGNIAQSSQNNINNAGSPSSLQAPSIDKASPKASLHAYFADMSTADPNVSLSEQTENARSRGNALYFEIKNGNKLMYSSPKSSELGYTQSDNLALSRLGNHFDYYNDYAVGLFKSDYSASLGNEERMKTQMNEALVIEEATQNVFDQIIIEFSGEVHRYNAIYYQTYLLNLKLACEGTPIGVKLPYSFLTSSSNSGVIAEIFAIADFCVIELGSKTADELKTSVEPLSYFIERYSAVIIISSSSASNLEERLAVLEEKGIKNYIVK